MGRSLWLLAVAAPMPGFCAGGSGPATVAPPADLRSADPWAVAAAEAPPRECAFPCVYPTSTQTATTTSRPQCYEFLRATGSQDLYFQSDSTPTEKHLVRKGLCWICGWPNVCRRVSQRSSSYIAGLATGADFACGMLQEAKCVDSPAGHPESLRPPTPSPEPRPGPLPREQAKPLVGPLLGLTFASWACCVGCLVVLFFVHRAKQSQAGGEGAARECDLHFGCQCCDDAEAAETDEQPLLLGSPLLPSSSWSIAELLQQPLWGHHPRVQQPMPQLKQRTPPEQLLGVERQPGLGVEYDIVTVTPEGVDVRPFSGQRVPNLQQGTEYWPMGGKPGPGLQQGAEYDIVTVSPEGLDVRPFGRRLGPELLQGAEYDIVTVSPEGLEVRPFHVPRLLGS